MLVSLKIDNFALVDRLDLNLNLGLNVMTGETGAGKSIILDAIDIVLGGSVNSRMIRSGCDRSFIEASFEIHPSIYKWLKEEEIDLLEDNTIVCSRELTLKNSKMRSRCRINGTVAKKELVRDLRSRLVEITAQGQTTNLLFSDRQRKLLDEYGGKSLLEQKKKVSTKYYEYQERLSILDKYNQSQQERLQRQDLLEYQLKELREAQLTTPSELEELEQERDRLSHVVELQQLSYSTLQIIYQNDREELAASDLLAQGETNLIEMSEYDEELLPVLEMIQNGIAQIVEAGQQLSSYQESLEADPERLDEISRRIRLLKQICRKYGPQLKKAIQLEKKLQAELDLLTGGEESLAMLEKEVLLAEKKLIEVCSKLTELRSKAATKLETQLVKELKPLAMDKVIFECRIIPIVPSANGSDKIEFYFSPNPGEKIQPLSLTASGGEMSRFLLALKACFSNSETNSHTLIFDEIDAGVSGKVAQAIAKKLYQLSKKNQVLCVTHQPLIAAMGDAHYKVEKTIIEEPQDKQRNGDSHIPDIRTVVRVKALKDRRSRIKELAQITGGNSADKAISFAESLLIKAEKNRS